MCLSIIPLPSPRAVLLPSPLARPYPTANDDTPTSPTTTPCHRVSRGWSRVQIDTPCPLSALKRLDHGWMEFSVYQEQFWEKILRANRKIIPLHFTLLKLHFKWGDKRFQKDLPYVKLSQRIRYKLKAFLVILHPCNVALIYSRSLLCQLWETIWGETDTL